MVNDLIQETQFTEFLLSDAKLIDVRAPIEFQEGSIPGSVNLPIMNNEERALVGTTFKQEGPEKAIELGLQLVSGKIKDQRVQAWIDFFKENQSTAISCFRGGLRSKTAQEWLAKENFILPRIEGGYKKLRRFLLQNIEIFCQQETFHVLSGATGSGKTLLLRSLAGVRRVCDLELYANHRGSAFGGYPEGQPTQINFENKLSVEMLSMGAKRDHKPVLIEDESRLIGKCVQPEILFNTLRASSIILIEESIESRAEVIFDDYVLGSAIGKQGGELALQTFATYKKSLERISRRLGGARTAEINLDLQNSIEDFNGGRGLQRNLIWIEKLLKYYYDPMYLDSLEKRSPQILFRGKRVDCEKFLR